MTELNTAERILYAESDSFIVWGRGYSDDEIPESMIQLIKDQRIKRIEEYQNPESQWYQKEEIFDYATDAEAMLYLSGASLTFPLNHTWASLYMLVFTKCFNEQMAREMDCYKTEDDFYKDELSELLNLKKWII